MRNILENATYQRHICPPNIAFAEYSFGKNCGEDRDVDWSLPPKDEKVRQLKETILRAVGAKIYYAPNMSVPNAKHVRRSSLQTLIPIGEGLRVFGNKDAPGEALMLDPGEGVIANTAGCALCTASFNDSLTVFHMGRRSLLDESRIRNECPGGRFNETVVDTAMRNLNSLGARHKVFVRIRKCVHPQMIPYPLVEDSPWAAFNRQMLDFIAKQGWGECVSIEENGALFYIDLAALARIQFMGWGVPKENIDLSDAYWENPDSVWLDGAKGTPRNFDLIVRFK